jgi:hypothetical protein
MELPHPSYYTELNQFHCVLLYNKWQTAKRTAVCRHNWVLGKRENWRMSFEDSKLRLGKGYGSAKQQEPGFVEKGT